MIAARQIFLGASRGNAEEEMYKELFIQLAEDTLPETFVVPDVLSKVGRSFWLCSSKVKDITLLGKEMTFANNTISYGSPNLKVIRMPNAIKLGYPSPSMNGPCEELYIPKLKQIVDRNNTFMTNSAKLDVHIDESTCQEIMAFANFPGTNNATMMAKLTFYGSDGTIKYNGSSWVITPNS